MLYLTGNSTNVIYTNVSANKELSNPTYLMSMTHQQTGKKWTFIPQNITSYSGNPYNNRYDIFKFDISGGTENLTGGTLGWYWEVPPYYVNGNDLRYTGTSKSYLQQRVIAPNVFGTVTWFYDFDNWTESITGATITLDGANVSVNQISYEGGTNIWFVRATISGSDFQSNGLLEIQATTDEGNTLSSSYYVTSWQNVGDVKPWELYGDSPIEPDKNYPITHIDTPSINIDEIGEFSYSIREQANPINLNPSLSYNRLEVGISYITELFSDIFYDSPDVSEVYNPD